ncbi:hypothetical protein AUJ66_08590 [Candidatus Desantisbacteria bacterium CG1_02_38_46]|uniref:site-specific DNA-methyltransferase (adenine-specific) n=3 Tax=unclassified Candidatus Desantisiibacteriota TaxID=3106372 RepID=A0A2H9PB38_9BACT|nr:MAG: hypothetical protein AUJ66_08590 [Candidatus Desantisbacteria bacterium CG1_02_38_46]PIU51968.1 MAG: hypothetical protein COS91_01715 [Candidatus Desantisbacteria bacterium CG07_land_8_20_14_0_80_39_15]PIZ15848.1 MAG: hypothetical protein COY51_04210 [Candidatus Desantisbacteria bacterium CG_4_10_14_0_8_um_filter_39_17]
MVNMIENICFPQTQYFGSKEKLGSFIIENVEKYIGLEKINTVFDAFSGSAYVGYIFKLLNKKVIGNDYLKFNYHVGNSLLVNNNITLGKKEIDVLFAFNKNKRQFFEKVYSDLFYTKEECKTLDNFRYNNEKLKGIKRSLSFAIMTKVLINMIPFGKFNYTTAIPYRNSKFKSYLNNYNIKEKFIEYSKIWNAAIYDNKKKNEMYCASTPNIVRNIKADLIYIDPPYIGTDYPDYYRYYHFLETFVVYPAKPVFIKKTKEVVKEKSRFSLNDKQEILKQFKILFERSGHIKYWVLSHNMKGYPSLNDFKELITTINDKRKINIIEKEYIYKSGYKRKNNYEYLLIAK